MRQPLFNKGISGWGQLGLLLGLLGAGMVAGSLIAAGVWALMTGQPIMQMQQDLLNPRYAGAVKLVQTISTLFVFLVPAAGYAFITYRNGWQALGFGRGWQWKLAGISLLIIAASGPLIDSLTSINKGFPLPAASRAFFDNMEKAYEDQVKVIAEVKSVQQFLLSLLLIAGLPAVFEELFFRGALQGMLQRWKGAAPVYVVLTALLLAGVYHIWFSAALNPLLFYALLVVLSGAIMASKPVMRALQLLATHPFTAIIFTSIIFSAIHGSWYGFLPRFALGMLLGGIFHVTRNLWYSILVHFVNNAAVVCYMFYLHLSGKPVAVTSEAVFPVWVGIISLTAIAVLFRWLSRSTEEDVPREIFYDPTNPFDERNTVA